MRADFEPIRFSWTHMISALVLNSGLAWDWNEDLTRIMVWVVITIEVKNHKIADP